jgi:hypothetical protein
MSVYLNDSYFKTLHPKSQKILLTNYPTGEYKSCIQYIYENSSIRLVVKDFSGVKKVYYL